MNESDFPSELPCLADLPTPDQFRNDTLARWDEPGAEPLLILHAALAAYETSSLAYDACSRAYLRRRELLQQGNSLMDEFAVRRLGLVDLRSLVVDSFLRAWRDFDRVYAAYYAWDLLDTSSDGRRTKASRDLKARLAAGIPSGQARQRVEALRRRRREDANEPKRTTARNRPMATWLRPTKRR